MKNTVNATTEYIAVAFLYINILCEWYFTCREKPLSHLTNWNYSLFNVTHLIQFTGQKEARTLFSGHDLSQPKACR